MFISCLVIRNAGQVHNIKIANKSENAAKFRCLWMTATYQNYICKDIKCRLNSDIAFQPFDSEWVIFLCPI